MRVVIFGAEPKVAPIATALRARGNSVFVRPEPSISLVHILHPRAVVLVGEGAIFDAFEWALRRLGGAPTLMRVRAEEEAPLALLGA